MAARRLLLVLALLLVASVVAASFAPDRDGPLIGSDGGDETSETTTESSGTTETTGDSDPRVNEGGDVGFEGEELIEASEAKPATAEASVGDQLALFVASEEGRTITIAPLGLTAYATPEAPARFDLLLRQPGTYPITDLEDPDVILGRLEVTEPNRKAR